MNIRVMGIDTHHSKGDFCRKARYDEFVFLYFQTPFTFLCDGEMLMGEKGDIVINTPNELIYHGPREDIEGGSINDWIHISGKDLEELLEKYPLPTNRAFHIDDGFFVHKLMKRIFTEYKQTDKGTEDMIKSLMTQLIIGLHRELLNLRTESVAQSEVAAVHRAINESPEKEWSLLEMASRSGYSQSRFCEIYRGLYGVAPMTDVIDKRILLARQLLSSGEVSVTNAAELCGFSNIGYFSKCFKSKTGQTPSQYMKAYKNAL